MTHIKNYKGIGIIMNILAPIFILISPVYGQEANAPADARTETAAMCSSASPTKAQALNEETSCCVDINKAYFKSYLTDTAYILSSPARWDKQDWLIASAVLAASMGLYFYDRQIQTWVQEQRNSTTNGISDAIRPIGQGQYALPAIGLFYIYGLAADDSRAKKTSLLCVKSFLISGMFTQVLKYATHRCRPSDCEKHDSWKGPGFSSSDLSFVSGEATTAFSLATVIASEYGDKLWVPPVAYGAATLIALARVNNNGHWASDVFMGAAIGYFTAKTITKLHKKKKIAVMPMIDGQTKAIGLIWNFR